MTSGSGVSWAFAMELLMNVSTVPKGVCTEIAPYFSTRSAMTDATAFTTRRACAAVPCPPASRMPAANSSAPTVRSDSRASSTGALSVVVPVAFA